MLYTPEGMHLPVFSISISLISDGVAKKRRAAHQQSDDVAPDNGEEDPSALAAKLGAELIASSTLIFG